MLAAVGKFEKASQTPYSRILVTGARGLLGSCLCDLLGPRAVPVGSRECDLLELDRLAAVIRGLSPDAVINCAAYTAVDLAEKDALRCSAINRDAVSVLAETTAALGIPLVQISTDYVFGGPPPTPERPWIETDPVSPAGVYARSKFEGELAAAANPHHTIVRTCGLYGLPPQSTSRNFVLTMLKLAQDRPTLKVVRDQVCSPTSATELAPAILHLLETNAHGIFHVVNEGGTSWYEFARAIFRCRGLTTAVEPISTAEYNAPAPRPSYSVLDIEKYRRTGGPPLSHWESAIQAFLQRVPA